MSKNENLNVSEKNTKKELLELINKLKKTEIIDMINIFNNVNLSKQKAGVFFENEKNNTNMSIKVEKKKIKIPKNLNKLKFYERKANNKPYDNI